MEATVSQRISGRVDSQDLTPAEGRLIKEYLVEMQSLNGSGDRSVISQMYRFITLAKIFHSGDSALDTAGTYDHLAAVAAIRGRPDLSPEYRKMLLATLRQFAIWSAGRNPDINIEKIKSIKIPATPKKKKVPEEMLSKDEVLQIIAAGSRSRDRALVATLYDGSNRPIELLSLNWGDLHFDEHGAWFATNCKTGKFRRIRLTLAVPYLAQWQADYPGGVRPEAPIFCSFSSSHAGGHPRLTKRGLDGIIVKLKKRTGIEKLHPYSFRPSRITHDVADGYDLQYIMMKNWGSVDTKMLEVYTNLSDDYVDSYALERAGMISPVAKVQESKKLLPIECPHCYTINTPGSGFCSRCGLALTAQAASEIGVIDRLDSQKARDVIEYLQDLIASGELPQPE